MICAIQFLHRMADEMSQFPLFMHSTMEQFLTEKSLDTQPMQNSAFTSRKIQFQFIVCAFQFLTLNFQKICFEYLIQFLLISLCKLKFKLNWTEELTVELKLMESPWETLFYITKHHILNLETIFVSCIHRLSVAFLVDTKLHSNRIAFFSFTSNIINHQSNMISNRHGASHENLTYV